MAESSTYQGPGLLTLLTVLFVTLKLLGQITWSWWWVLSPTLIPLGVILLVLVVMLIGAAVGKGA